MTEATDEEIKFREHLVKGIASDWISPTTKAHFERMLADFDAYDPDNYIDSGRFYATLHYSATGEGEYAAFISADEASAGAFLRHVIGKVGWYYGVSCQYGRSLNDLSEGLVNQLITPMLRHSLARDQCSVTIFIEHHINCS